MRVLKLLVLVGSLFCIQAAIAEVVSDDRASAMDTSAQDSISQRNNDTNLWFEAIEGDHTVYRQFNEVYDTVQESIANLATRLTNYVAENRISKLIRDLRFNMGATTA